MRMDGRVVSAAMPAGAQRARHTLGAVEVVFARYDADAVGGVTAACAEDRKRIFQVLACGARAVLLHDARAVDAVRREVVGHGFGLRDILARSLTAGDDDRGGGVRVQIGERRVEPVAHRQRRRAAVDARAEHDDRVGVRVGVRARVAHDGDRNTSTAMPQSVYPRKSCPGMAKRSTQPARMSRSAISVEYFRFSRIMPPMPHRASRAAC